MKFLKIVFSDFFHSGFFKVIGTSAMVLIIGQLLLVPATYLALEVNSKVPIVRSMSLGEGLLTDSEEPDPHPYRSLFLQSFDSFGMFIVSAVAGLIMTMFSLVAWLIAPMGIMLASAIIIVLAHTIVKSPKWAKSYIAKVKERAENG